MDEVMKAMNSSTASDGISTEDSESQENLMNHSSSVVVTPTTVQLPAPVTAQVTDLDENSETETEDSEAESENEGSASGASADHISVDDSLLRKNSAPDTVSYIHDPFCLQ